MKKLSTKQKLSLIRRAKRRLYRRLKNAISRAPSAAQLKFDQQLNTLPKVVWRDARDGEDNRFVYFDAPENFSLYTNYEETLAFLMVFRKALFQARTGRKRGNKFIYANFSTIKSVEPAAGLALAAEIHRWSRWVRRKPRTHDHKWQKNVRDFFKHAGLFDLLEIIPMSDEDVVSTPDSEEVRVLRFRTGSLTDGPTAKEMKLELEKLAGEKISTRTFMFTALCEGMNNVTHHAYKNELLDKLWPEASICKNWWAYGVWLPRERKIKMIIIDQGVGIPQTLPYSSKGKSILEKIWRAVDLFKQSGPTDADCIEGAMLYGNTSTGKQGRGKGLGQMGEWIDQTETGYFRIISGSGMITKTPGTAIVKQTLAAQFLGTLVEWELKL